MVELLLKAGAPVQAQDKQGGTPVDWAQRFGHQEVVQLLLEARAELKPQATGALAVGASTGSAEAKRLLILLEGCLLILLQRSAA